MSAITASDVKKLRDMTGAGMMDCKKALAEADGDFDKAVEVLRKQGQKMSAKRADRDATEGVVIAVVNDDRNRGVIIKLSSETDFVAKNQEFVNLAEKFAELALEHFPADKEGVLAIPYGNITIGEKITEQVGVIGEKIELAAYERVEAEMVAPYIHMGNKAGVLIGMSKADDSFFEPGRAVAMQVAAMRPVAVDKDGVDATVVEKEIEIGKEQARNEGKPEAMLEKIALGKLNKFYKENTLLNQQFVRDNKQSVAQYLQSFDPELTVTEFKHVELG
ncbi:translation elongation factor Ts [Flavilitoribacter nigricans]|uniref:Elongation factor Ts n=1 Tax=Flavilitoribacter nigricans (strain ATCC 23147 / DSM 23189 / NBRC 102662 / NCIMB 1420 / SS-2) TaxID=1122177 RepID=A0A2D0N3G8_FLAN2|nr:translation elongation factor Ts [Flavilitoribacter nigricans]PHN02940.1 elongation factor Ts [Flavilitoribacter nigricans DSM 23189 = NBRC 102662]